ncbi:MAG TPA: dienelactone hydrolase family protein [Gemmatimonadaceae bacterium]|nr:dienelactone hydrolase family protein [Gemmatimonadaceae bacterium]
MSTTIRSDAAREVVLEVAGEDIHADLVIPDDAHVLVVMAYPTAFGRHEAPHTHVARLFNQQGFATLLCDLLTSEEEMLGELTGEFRRDVPLLTTRLSAILDWCEAQPELRHLPVGLVGIGTAAAVALQCAAHRAKIVRAVVVRGGRLDLAWWALGRVHAPTLLVAGEHDTALREVYRAYVPYIGSQLKEVAIVPQACSPFAEQHMLDEFAELAAGWFTRHLDQRTAHGTIWHRL